MVCRLFFVLLCWLSALASQASPGAADASRQAADVGDGRQGAPERQDDALDVEAILTETSPASEYSRSFNCIRSTSYRKIEMLDEHHLLFTGRRAAWLNRLRHRCRLHGDVVFVLEPSSSRLCDMDRVRGHDRFGISGWRGTCVLGEFQQIDPQQAAALKEAVALAKERRR